MPITTSTVRSGFWGSGFALKVNREPMRYRIIKALRKRQTVPLRELMDTVNGVAVGASAVQNTRQVTYTTAQAGNFSGIRPTANRVLINRVTVSADTTANAAIYADRPVFATYPPDRAGHKRRSVNPTGQ